MAIICVIFEPHREAFAELIQAAYINLMRTFYDHALYKLKKRVYFFK